MRNWADKRIVITGGSQGLGFEIAKAFGHRGAKVTLIARGEQKLIDASGQLKNEGITSTFKVCDVCDWNAVQTTFEELKSEHADIDVLVNAVGKSTRADIENLDIDEAHQMMDVNYFSAFHCIKASLPAIKSNGGHIVNIGSLSSKTAWPYMTPYTASKFALAALTHQLRIELGDHIHAMLVCPGPIKREDAGSRYDANAADLPEDARKPGGGARLKGICPTKLAEKIIRGCEKKKAEIIVPWKSKLLFITSSISSRLGDWLIRKNRKN